MSRHAECARRFYDALNKRGIEALDSFFDSDVVVVEPPDLPDAATTHGLQAARAGLAKFTSLFDELGVTIEEPVVRGDRTFTTIHVVGTGTGSGATVELTRHDVLTWRDAKVVRAELNFDREAALRVFESEQDDREVR
jgi:ketosteroid isomerase-like protein